MTAGDLTAGGTSGPGGDSYLYAHLQVDAQASLHLRSGLSVVVYGLNLKNEVFGFYNGSPQYVVQREFYKPTFAAGLRWSPKSCQAVRHRTHFSEARTPLGIKAPRARRNGQNRLETSAASSLKSHDNVSRVSPTLSCAALSAVAVAWILGAPAGLAAQDAGGLARDPEGIWTIATPPPLLEATASAPASTARTPSSRSTAPRSWPRWRERAGRWRGGTAGREAELALPMPDGQFHGFSSSNHPCSRRRWPRSSPTSGRTRERASTIRPRRCVSTGPTTGFTR